MGSHEWDLSKAHHHGIASVFIHPQILTCSVEGCGLNAMTLFLQFIHSLSVF